MFLYCAKGRPAHLQDLPLHEYFIIFNLFSSPEWTVLYFIVTAIHTDAQEVIVLPVRH